MKPLYIPNPPMYLLTLGVKQVGYGGPMDPWDCYIHSTFFGWFFMVLNVGKYTIHPMGSVMGRLWGPPNIFMNCRSLDVAWAYSQSAIGFLLGKIPSVQFPNKYAIQRHAALQDSYHYQYVGIYGGNLTSCYAVIIVASPKSHKRTQRTKELANSSEHQLTLTNYLTRQLAN